MFPQRQQYYQEIKIILALAIPLIATGAVEAAIGFFSTLFLARLGPQELAAGALVNWLFFTLLVLMWGLLSAVSVMVAQRYGAKDSRGIAAVLQDSVLFSAAITLPVMILLWNISPILLYFGQKPAMVLLSKDYLHALAYGVFPDFCFLVLQQFLIGLGHTRANMFFTFIWVPLNIAANYILMFGKWGFPALGIAGIGWGTTISFWIMTIIIALYILFHKAYQPYLPFKIKTKLFATWKELLRIGVPMGAMFTVEIAFFLTLTLVMGRLGVNELAANQIVMQYLAIFGMIIFCTAQAITVRVGHNIGANNPDTARLSTYCGTLVSVLLTSTALISYWLFPEFLIKIDLGPMVAKNQIIFDLAKQFLLIAAFFQLGEAVRFSLFGSLRGMGDTSFTLWVSIIIFWFVGLPLGYLFAKTLSFQGVGYWWGLVFGVIIGIILLIFRFKAKIQEICLVKPTADLPHPA